MTDYYKYHPTTGKKLSREHENKFIDTDGNAFYDNPVPAVNVILINPEQEILLLERNENPHRGSLDFPGGFIENGENADQAIKREVKEELGFELDTLNYFSTYSDVYPQTIDGNELEIPIITIIYFSVLKRTPSFTINREVINPKFYKFSEIPSQKIKFKTIKMAISDFSSEFIEDENTEDLINFHLD